MKHIFTIVLVSAVLAVSLITLPFAAHAACTSVSPTFPSALDTFVANDCIPSSWANTLEQVIGTTTSTATSSLQYRVNNLPAAASTTSINGVQGPTFTFSIVSTSSQSSITTSTMQLFLNLLRYASGTDINVSPTGTINFVNTPGFITGNQTITLTGPVTGSGATTIATTIVSPLNLSTINASTSAITTLTGTTANETTINVTSTLTNAGSENVNTLNVSSTATFKSTVGITGHIGFATSSVTVNNGTIVGSDSGGYITVATPSSTVKMTFVTPWNFLPSCIANAASTTINIVRWLNVTTSTLQFNDANPFQTSSQIFYQCQGNPN